MVEHADYELTYQISMLKAQNGEKICNAVQLSFSEYVKGDEKPKDCELILLEPQTLY